MEADDILKARSHLNRQQFQQKITDAAEAQTEQALPTAYTGFDAELGLAKLQDGNGDVFYGNAQTNGAIAVGENIRLRRGGVLAGYDSMPRKIVNFTPVPELRKSIIMGLFVYKFTEYGGINDDFYVLYPHANFVYNFKKKIASSGLKNIRNDFLRDLEFQVSHNVTAGDNDPSIITRNQGLFNILYYSGGNPIYIVAQELFDKDLSFVKIALLKFQDYKLIKVTEINTESGFSPEYKRSGNSENYRQVFKYQTSDGKIKFVIFSGTAREISPKGGFYLWEFGSPGNHYLMGTPSSKFGLIQYGITSPSGDLIRLYMRGGYGSVSGIVVNCFFSPSQFTAINDTSFSIFIPEAYLTGSSNIPIPLTDIIFSQQPDSTYWGVVNVGDMPPPIDTRDIIYPYFSSVGYFNEVIYQPGSPLQTALAAWTIPEIDKNKTTFKNL